MTTDDLRARGFVENARLPVPYTFCAACRAYRFFTWWDAPQDALGAKVSVCSDCESVPSEYEPHVQRFPVLTEV